LLHLEQLAKPCAPVATRLPSWPRKISAAPSGWGGVEMRFVDSNLWTQASTSFRWISVEALERKTWLLNLNLSKSATSEAKLECFAGTLSPNAYICVEDKCKAVTGQDRIEHSPSFGVIVSKHWYEVMHSSTVAFVSDPVVPSPLHVWFVCWLLQVRCPKFSIGGLPRGPGDHRWQKMHSKV